MPRLCWNSLGIGLDDGVNVEAVSKGCSSEIEEQDLSQSERLWVRCWEFDGEE
jgi:hypothetical protein